MTLVVENDRLAEVAASARLAGRIALDTEFVGEGRYRTLLCLVQLAIPGEPPGDVRIVLVDPLDDGLEGSALAAVLADPSVEVIVHAGRQDIALLRRRLATDVVNVFDTQLAAAFAGLGAQSSYESLLAEVLGLRVAKTASFTRWDARPLSGEQLSYAREDVLHLLDLATALEQRLSELGRLQWAREECEALAGSSDVRDPREIFDRLPRVGTLSASARPVARALVEWRERTAEANDRPVQSVLADAPLMEVAKRKPHSRAQLQRIRGIGGAASGRRADELLAVVERARSLPPEPTPARARGPIPRPSELPLVALCEALLRARAAQAGLAYELLATRADLQAIVAARRDGREADVRTLRGWRRELAGDELLALLDGRLGVSVERGGDQARLRIEGRG